VNQMKQEENFFRSHFFDNLAWSKISLTTLSFSTSLNQLTLLFMQMIKLINKL